MYGMTGFLFFIAAGEFASVLFLFVQADEPIAFGSQHHVHSLVCVLWQDHCQVAIL